jgi:hypothetical protein
MYNPFDLIPHTIDKTLRDLIITLVVIQFSAFLILLGYIIYEYVKFKVSDKSIVQNEEDKKEEINFDNDEKVEENKENAGLLNENDTIEDKNISTHIKQD